MKLPKCVSNFLFSRLALTGKINTKHEPELERISFINCVFEYFYPQQINDLHHNGLHLTMRSTKNSRGGWRPAARWCIFHCFHFELRQYVFCDGSGWNADAPDPLTPKTVSWSPLISRDGSSQIVRPSLHHTSSQQTKS